MNNKKISPIDKALYIFGLIVGILAIIAALILSLLDLSLPQIPCVFKEVTGLYCMGCGGTHAALIFFQGDFLKAIRLNAFVVCMISYYILYMVLLTIHIFTKRKTPYIHFSL